MLRIWSAPGFILTLLSSVVTVGDVLAQQTDASQNSAIESVVFRILPTGNSAEEREMYETLLTYLEPRRVTASAGTSIYELIRKECGIAGDVHLEIFRRLNPGVPGTTLSDSLSVALPPCPYWASSPRTTVPVGGTVADEARLLMGTAGHQTLNEISRLNPQLGIDARTADEPDPRIEGEPLRLKYAVFPAALELREEHRANPEAAVAALSATPGARTVELDRRLAELVREVEPAMVSETCLAPAESRGWPFSATAILSALRHNDQIRPRLALPSRSSRILVGIADTGIDPDETRLPLYRSPLEDDGGADNFDDDDNEFVDDVFGVNMPRRAGPPHSDARYSRYAHGTSVAGLAVGDVGSEELRQEVASRVELSIISLVDRYGTDAQEGQEPQSVFVYPKDAIALALAYRPYHEQISVLNFSIRSPERMEAFDEAMESVTSLVVVAAGNEGWDLDNSHPVYPVYYRRTNHPGTMITVAAHVPLTADQRLTIRQGPRAPADAGVLTQFTNYGQHTVDLAAPGCSIETIAPGGSRASVTGSSFAAPLVSLTGALLMSEGIRGGVRTKHRIMASVDVVPGLPVHSQGILNIEKSLAVFEDLLELRDGQLLRGRIEPPHEFRTRTPRNWNNILKIVPLASSGAQTRVLLFRTGPEDELIIEESAVSFTDVGFLDWATGNRSVYPLSDIIDIIPAAAEYRRRNPLR